MPKKRRKNTRTDTTPYLYIWWMTASTVSLIIFHVLRFCFKIKIVSMRFLNWVSFLTPALDVRGSEHSAMELSFYFNWLSTTVLLSCNNCWRKLPSYVSTYCLHGISEYFSLFARVSQSFDVLVSELCLIVTRKYLAIRIRFFLECKFYVHC